MFDLRSAQCGVLAPFRHHERNPLETPSNPGGSGPSGTLEPRVPCSRGLRGSGTEPRAGAEGSWGAGAGGAATEGRLWSKARQSVDVCNDRIVTGSVISFRVWLHAAGKGSSG